MRSVKLKRAQDELAELVEDHLQFPGCDPAAFDFGPCLVAQILAKRQEIRNLERACIPDEPGRLNVIVWQKRFSRSDRVYDYCAIHAGDGRWYTSGPEFNGANPHGVRWEAWWPFVVTGLVACVVHMDPAGFDTPTVIWSA